MRVVSLVKVGPLEVEAMATHVQLEGSVETMWVWA